MISVNYIAVVIAAVLAMVLGTVWYSKGVFGNAWMKLIGKNESDLEKGNMGALYGTMFVGVLIEAYVLAVFANYAGVSDLMGGVKLGLWAWLGFVATTSLGNSMFEGRPMKLFYINAGYALVNLIVMGGVISLIR